MKSIMRYILDQAAVEQVPGAGGYSGVVKEKGNSGKRLVDFLRDPHAVSAELELAHIAALRLYTSDAYTCINGPLRKGCSTAEPHPFAATTLFLSDALKKLRTLNAVDSAEITKRKEFWRGMRVREKRRERKTERNTHTHTHRERERERERGRERERDHYHSAVTAPIK
jgi:hypothetical protein